MLLIRKIHAYVGLLIAPSVLFFALSGALQIFDLHEAHGPYHPPALLRALGHLHKDQVLSKPEPRLGPPAKTAPAAAAETGPAAGAGKDDEDPPQIKTYILKWFFALVAAGLFASTSIGLWIGLRVSRTPRLSWGLLISGAAIPVLILFL